VIAHALIFWLVTRVEPWISSQSSTQPRTTAAA